MIIPFFIPFAGCPHQCVFCNQKSIISQAQPIEPSSIPRTITQYLETNRSCKPVSVAFYGGSFTALPLNTQRSYLQPVQPFIKSGQITGIRLSTRPDCITPEILARLKEYGVTTVELGAQSMSDSVLEQSGRGHTSADTIEAMRLLKQHGFTVGIQLMIGLPGDIAETFSSTITTVIAQKPDFVRLYPLLVIKDTLLETQYNAGEYIPLLLDEAIVHSRTALERFERAGIEIIRIGLQPSEELESPGTILAGPYHPAFRQLVESSILLDKMRSALHARSAKTDIVEFRVNLGDVSTAIGQQRANINILKKECGLHAVHVVGDKNMQTRRAVLLIS
jgi:histone acetyltransferase (RNA polymerase elongator complex component)